MSQFDVTVVYAHGQYSVLAWVEGKGFEQRVYPTEAMAVAVAAKLELILQRRYK